MSRRRGRGRALARRYGRGRYGCFRLPKVDGAKVVKEARGNPNWLARTDPDAKEVEFSHAWEQLGDPDKKRYIVIHEQAHLETGPDHNDAFYTVLKRLIEEHRVPWKIAYELEAYNCHHKH